MQALGAAQNIAYIQNAKYILCNLRDYIYEQTSNFDGTVTFCLCKLDDKKNQRWTLYTNKSCQELLRIEQHAQRLW